MKLYTKTFGCQMNFADSDEMGRHFKERGFVVASNEDEADAVLVNTCTVRDLAEHKAMSFIGKLKDWKAEQPERIVIVTGCAAEQTKQTLKKRFPHVDLVVGAKDIAEFPEQLDRFLSKSVIASKAKQSIFENDITGNNRLLRFARNDYSEESLLASESLASPISQYVTIMRGCNYNCSYCIVPSVRGREYYRPAEDILKEVASRTREGAKEIWLLGQTVNSYRPEFPPRAHYDFSDLLQDVCSIPDVGRIRFISPHPYYLSQKLIQTMADNKKICEHIHLPVQSGSNKILKRMKRNYTRESYLSGLRALREAIPSVAITTDIIVGFPGETKEDYLETLSLIQEADFDSAYCFKYSPRPGTESAQWEDDVPQETKEERINHLLDLTEAQGRLKARNLIGTTQEVLIEEDKGNNLFRGKTRGAWRIRIENPTLQPGQTVWAKVTNTHSRELHGELLEAPRPMPSLATL